MTTFKDFVVLETIGKGSFASVHKVIRKSDNKVYAIKRVKISKMSKKEIADSLNEIRFLASVRHKNIVGFLEAFLENDDSELCIVMEYCGCGDLSQKVERYKRRRKYIDEAVIWRYLIQCLKALQCLHELGICHRDIKVGNTFLAEDGSVKVGDMNVSKMLKKGQLQTQIGTPYYMSPEIWNNKPYDSSSDIWSLGCMIYELASLRPPFIGDSFPSLKRAVVCGRYSTIPKKYSESLGKVISSMLKVNAKERPSAISLLNSPELVSKLQYDNGLSIPSQQENQMNLMETIKVPGNLRQLQSALPKPCYPVTSAVTISAVPKPSSAPLPPTVPAVDENNSVNKIPPNLLVKIVKPSIAPISVDKPSAAQIPASSPRSISELSQQKQSIESEKVDVVQEAVKVASPRIPLISRIPLFVPRVPSIPKPAGVPSRPSYYNHRIW